jgi:hypothetical protein
MRSSRSAIAPATIIAASIACPLAAHGDLFTPIFSPETGYTPDPVYGPGITYQEDPQAALSSRFTLAVLPDTQNYSEFFPDTYLSQTQWLVNNRKERNIRFVSHVGDVVNNGDNRREWQNSQRAMDVLRRDNLPFGVANGNHDSTPSGISGSPFIPQNYLEFYGPQTFKGRDWYRGASPSGLSNYQTFRGGGREWLVMHISVDTPYTELEWAQGVLAANRHLPTMITTHRYLQDAEDYTAGVPLVSSGRYPGVWYGIEGTYDPNGIQSDAFWQDFVRRQRNVFMVQCGHFHEEFRQTSTNLFGNAVHEILADYQDDPNGGDGWLRLMEFDTANNRINVESYSTTLNQFRTADESRFSLNTNFNSYSRSRGYSYFQNGINGYTGTRDTWISEASGNTSFGNNPNIIVDDDVNNSIFNDRRGQGLLKFEGITSPTGANQTIPLGATIEQAFLTLHVPDDIDSPFSSPRFFVYLMTRDWNESSTWNSLSGGLTQGADFGQLIATFSGDNTSDGDILRLIDVRAAVQAWANGAPNFGLAIIPEIIGGNDDGIELHSSEFNVAILRPSLEVLWTTGIIPSPSAAGLLAMSSAIMLRRRR